MRTRTGHRQEVMDRSQRCLEGEMLENEALKAASQQRRRKIDRARRKLERVMGDNMVVQKQIETQLGKLKEGERAKECILSLYFLMQVKECLQPS